MSILITQEVVEVVVKRPRIEKARITQEVVEVVVVPSNRNALLTQMAVEVVVKADNSLILATFI